MASSNKKRNPEFGTRRLINDDEVFDHNAWDDIEWSEEMEEEAKHVIDLNSSEKMSDEKRDNLDELSQEYWNRFYTMHENKFFKNRAWLQTEFPELFEPIDQKRVIFDAGCGVGNTTFPILNLIKDDKLFIYASDFSESAIKILKDSEEYDTSRCSAFTYDITHTEAQLPFEENSLDFILLIFVLSAISPTQFQSTIDNLVKYLKPGGMILFRDYGLYDMAQLRFKKGKCISENFYARSDGTRVYFFTSDKLHKLFTEASLEQVENKLDRRLLVNRKKQMKMYRVWVQCKYRKKLR